MSDTGYFHVAPKGDPYLLQPVDQGDWMLLGKMTDIGFSWPDRLPPLELVSETVSDTGKSIVFEKTDFTWLGSHTIAGLAKALDLLAPLLHPGVSEIRQLDHGMSMLATGAVVGALDLERSEVVRYPSSGRVRSVLRFAFDSEAIAGLHVFRIEQSSSIIVSEFLRDAVVESGLTGLGFSSLPRAQ